MPKTLRIAADQADINRAPIDARTGRKLFFFQGNNVKIDVALFDAGQMVDVSGISSVFVQIKELRDLSATPALVSVEATTFDNTLTLSTWGDETKQHLTVDIGADKTALIPAGVYRLCIWDASNAQQVTYLSGEIKIAEDSAGSLDESLVDLDLGFYFKGFWSPADNLPALSNAVGTRGDFYVAQSAGTVDLGAGDLTFATNDRAVYDGNVWQLVKHPSNEGALAAEAAADAAATSEANAAASAQTAQNHSNSAGSDALTAINSATSATTKAAEAATLRDQTQAIADSIQQPPQTLTDAAVVVYNAALGLNATLTLTASRWLQVISNATAGQSGQLWIYQDAVGSHSLTLDYGYSDVLGNLSDIATLAAGEMALVRWFTEDGASFDLYINKVPAFPITQFSPLNYLTATDGVQVAGGADALDGESVALWANQSGTGTGATQTVAVSQPTFMTSPDRLKFDGVDDNVSFNLDGSAGYTISLKVSSEDWSKSQALASLWVNYQFLIRKFSGAVPWEIRFFTNPSLSITDSINANAADDWVIVMTHDAVNQKVRVIFNGREFEENYTFDVSSYPAKKFELGSYANQPSWYSDANFHKFFAAERALSMDEMRTLSSFLQKS